MFRYAKIKHQLIIMTRWSYRLQIFWNGDILFEVVFYTQWKDTDGYYGRR